MKIILLTTLSFPYDLAKENTFLQHEINYLSKYFDKLIIIPLNVKGKKEEIDLKNVSINIDLAKYLSKQQSKIYRLRILFNLSFYKELIVTQHFLSITKIMNTLSFLAQAKLITKWYKSYLVTNEYLTNNTVIYTYWTTSATHGISQLKKKYKNLIVISRAHGIDLYEERGHVCCRRETLELIDQIHCVSKAGYNYLVKLYPKHMVKYFISPLGVIKYPEINSVTDDKIFVIVSCSQLIEIKRVDLIAKAISILAEKNIKNLEKIIWYHFGEGESNDKLLSILNKINCKLIECNLMGYVENNSIMDFYSNKQVNLFITTSLTEGRPVSILEALSFGIPVLATKVGGIPELVDDSVGKLLCENPSPDEIAEGILFFINNKNMVSEMRFNAINKWEKELNAETNFELFAKNISELI